MKERDLSLINSMSLVSLLFFRMQHFDQTLLLTLTFQTTGKNEPVIPTSLLL